MKRDEVFDKLAQVLDPELDQSLTELNFIHDVQIEGNDVTVVFRLPTFWCAPNFAFLMASDIRTRVSELAWVNQVNISLIDHCASDAINNGVSRGRSFTETFPEMSDEELDALRARFRRKSFLSRQERLYRYLVRFGLTDDDISTMTVGELESLEIEGDEGGVLCQRYLDVRDELGHTNAASSTAFVNLEGHSLSAAAMSEYMFESRKTRVSQEFNGVYCRGLLRTRYEEQSAQRMEATH